MGYAAKLRHLPVVLARLRRRAGHQTQRAAARAIRARALSQRSDALLTSTVAVRQRSGALATVAVRQRSAKSA
jgi:hypothetical protein